MREETRMHVHVHSGKGEAKFWLHPDIELARNFGFSRDDLKKIEKLIEENINEINNAWKKHFSN